MTADVSRAARSVQNSARINSSRASCVRKHGPSEKRHFLSVISSPPCNIFQLFSRKRLLSDHRPEKIKLSNLYDIIKEQFHKHKHQNKTPT